MKPFLDLIHNLGFCAGLSQNFRNGIRPTFEKQNWPEAHEGEVLGFTAQRVTSPFLSVPQFWALYTLLLISS